MSNPFALEAGYQSLVVITDAASVPLLEAAFEPDALSIASFEHPDETRWKTELMLSQELDRPEVEARLARARKAGAAVEKWELKALEMRDWVSDIQAQFPPLEVGRFFIHGSHIAPRAAPAISLEINAGQAFGTGEHETTEGCLRALQWLAWRRRFATALDLGCGSGILALAAKKLWKDARVIASDMDAVAVRVARENARDNREPAVRFYTAAGLRHAALWRAQPFDLVVANILARPLIALAGEIVAATRCGGYAVLSGLLTRQEKEVLLAYRSRGLRLEKTIRRNGWSVLVLRR